MMLAQGKAVVDLTDTPFEVDASVPPKTNVPWNLQLLTNTFVALSIDSAPYATVVLIVMFEICICVGVVAPELPISP
jgi:hypothetical protein